MAGFQFDCEFCDRTVEAGTVESLKKRGKRHLTDEHDTELAGAFAETVGGEPCRNDCGYVFPVGVDEVAGFECPTCGHDNLPPFLERYLYWRIESR